MGMTKYIRVTTENKVCVESRKENLWLDLIIIYHLLVFGYNKWSDNSLWASIQGEEYIFVLSCFFNWYRVASYFQAHTWFPSGLSLARVYKEQIIISLLFYTPQ